MKSKLAIRSLYSPRHPDTRGKCCLKLTDLFHCPPLLFTMMMQSHVTQFWPPDWLWLIQVASHNARPPLLKIYWPLPVLVGVVGDGDRLQWGHGCLLLLAPNKYHLQPPSSGCLPQEGTRQARQPLTSSEFIHLSTPLGCGRPPPRQVPSLAPVRVVMRWPEGAKTPEVGPHPEGLKAKTGEIDPPPEDLENVSEASPVTILWTMSPNMWPWARKETSPT